MTFSRDQGVQVNSTASLVGPPGDVIEDVESVSVKDTPSKYPIRGMTVPPLCYTLEAGLHYKFKEVTGG